MWKSWRLLKWLKWLMWFNSFVIVRMRLQQVVRVMNSLGRVGIRKQNQCSTTSSLKNELRSLDGSANPIFIHCDHINIHNKYKWIKIVGSKVWVPHGPSSFRPLKCKSWPLKPQRRKISGPGPTSQTEFRKGGVGKTMKGNERKWKTICMKDNWMTKDMERHGKTIDFRCGTMEMLHLVILWRAVHRQATDHGIAREARSITIRHIDQGPVVKDGVLLEV